MRLKKHKIEAVGEGGEHKLVENLLSWEIKQVWRQAVIPKILRYFSRLGKGSRPAWRRSSSSGKDRPIRSDCH